MIEQIDGLARAIYDQCGMRASVNKTFSDFGLEVQVQVRLSPDADPDTLDGWQFFRANGEEQLARLRDELVSFIAANRKEKAA